MLLNISILSFSFIALFFYVNFYHNYFKGYIFEYVKRIILVTFPASMSAVATDAMK